ncbi:MAG TPA: glycosyltransferase, partial [Bacteroidales bacterium]|nr:glycosyltransferase [Bacteroidales bacterium]
MSKLKSTSGLSGMLAAVLRKKVTVSSQEHARPHLCFVNTTKSWGGGERWHFENARYAGDAGFDVSLVVASGSELEYRAAGAGLQTETISLSNLSFLNPVKLQKLYRYFRKKAVDVVIFNGPADLKSGGIAAMRAGIPVRVYRRGLAKTPGSGFLNRFLFNHALTDFIVNSKATASLLFSDETISREDARVHLLYNGLEPQDDKSDVNEHSVPVLGNASRFVEQKGLHYLLEMASVLKKQGEDFVLRIAGSGPLESSLKAKSKELGVENLVQ